MCGIAGIYAYREAAPSVDEQELLRIREAMIHRGPDGAGLWISPDRKIGLAHRRLAIIDLSDAGAQPMATADGNFRIAFNGEIYNYRELRKELEAKGYRFHSNSDTEVLLHLYAERGPDMVQALRGMYAFGIWDEYKKGEFLARDPFGIKPLYYAARAPKRKADFARALTPPLPDEIVNRAKTGFVILVREWCLDMLGKQADVRGIRGWAKHVMQQASPAANVCVPATAQ